MDIDNKRDILLLLLYSPGSDGDLNEAVRGRTRLVKMLFLFKQEILNDFKHDKLKTIDFYEFYSWSYGPFSKGVYDDLSFFILRGFVLERSMNKTLLDEELNEYQYWLDTIGADSEDTVEVFSESEYLLTEKGIKYTSQMFDPLSEKQKDILRSFKARVNKVGLRRLLMYVYTRYPQFTDKSFIKGDLLH